jgi:carboxypeptidase T
MGYRRICAIPALLLCAALFVGFGALSSISASAQEEYGPPRYFVDVFVPDLKDVQRLADEHFDIAGVNREQMAVGIVATDADLARISDLGFSYTIREYHATSEPLPKALSDYTDPAEMETFINTVVANYPDLAQKILVKDGLFESHKIWAVKITQHVGTANDRPCFLLDAQHHAREVMTGEIARDMIDYLTSRYATDSQVQNWLNNVNVYVIPEVNPDGIAYVFTGDNMWRKNRHPRCPVDINRNYAFMWNGCNGSTNICSDDTNRGTSAQSEPETKAWFSSCPTSMPYSA